VCINRYTDKNFKELKQKITNIEDKILKLDVSYKYLEVKSNMNNSTLENSTEDDNRRTLTLRKLNKKIIELNYNLNPESKKVRRNTCRHPLLKKIFEMEDAIKDNKHRLEELENQPIRKKRKADVVIDIEQPLQASSSTNKKNTSKDNIDEESEYQPSDGQESDNRLSDLEIDGNISN